MLIAQIKLARIYTQKYVKYVKMVVYYFKGIKLRRLIAKINSAFNRIRQGGVLCDDAVG